MTGESVKADLGLGRVLRGWVRSTGVNIRDCAWVVPFLFRVHDEKKDMRGTLVPSSKLLIEIEAKALLLVHGDLFQRQASNMRWWWFSRGG